jgi:Glycosyl transferase family 2
MKLVMTLLARDEVDIVESWLAFHLNAGVDFVIATDNRSQDGTTEILERYAREGYVHLIHEPGEDLRQDEWVTRMARLAATDFGADWVVNSDADEFWWPRGASLSEVLAAVPARYGTVSAFLRTFVPRPDDGSTFAERLTVRFSALAPINDPASLYKPIRKVVHRAHPEIRLARGNHALVDSPFAPLRGWFPIEVFHFPIRSLAQCEHKALLQGTAFERYVARPPTGYHAQMFAALNSGRIADYYDSLVIDDDELEQGSAEGRLVVDTRLRDSLRRLRAPDGGEAAFLLHAEAPALTFPTPTLVEDADYAVEAAVLGEADVVRLQRRLDTLERRLASIELRLPNRVYRKVARTAKRVLGRDGANGANGANGAG